jgi:diaminohydroxyphosphoribosylaminopyrimidine deaminase/5-amino-6-(5-phosphoribosylamino)uracil reductase
MGATTTDDQSYMRRAVALGDLVRGSTSPNPWVGAVAVSPNGHVVGEGATEPPGGRHAEVIALQQAAQAAEGGTLFVTLEPCSHFGRTPPCVDAVLASGVARVVVGVVDPDPRVSGAGVAALRAAGLDVTVGAEKGEVTASLAPYLKHRSVGRPWVVLKLAATLDGRVAAADGSSRWITGEEARRDAHRLRALSDAVIVGAGTVRRDDPELTVRDVEGRDPLRVVLGRIPPGARVEPATEWLGDLGALLDRLGADGAIQVLVEGGGRVAHSFHTGRLVDQYVVYVAPALMGGDDGTPMLRGPGAPSITEIWRGRLAQIRQLGEDVRIDVVGASGDAGLG